MKEGICITGALKKDRAKIEEDRGPMDLTLLVEQHGKEVWALKEQLSEASKELTVLRGTKGVVTQLSNELVRMKKRAQEAEGENTIIKGIGLNSPEMKALRKENEELKAELAREKEDHQYDNLVHANELKRMGKK